MQLSSHFSLEELTASEYAARHAIDNLPPLDALENLRRAAAGMEIVRGMLGAPIHVNSGYRSTRLNAAIGGVASSAHLTGHAVDFISPQFSAPHAVACAIREARIGFDQLILEYGWVHISFAPAMRGEMLTKRSASSPYEAGLLP